MGKKWRRLIANGVVDVVVDVADVAVAMAALLPVRINAGNAAAIYLLTRG